MTSSYVGVLGLGALLVLLLARIPVAFVMFTVGFCGISALDGTQAALSLLASETFTLASSPELVVIPLFILMGNVASATGMSRRLYDAAPEPKAFEIIAGAGHNDTVLVGGRAYFERIGRFLDEHAS